MDCVHKSKLLIKRFRSELRFDERRVCVRHNTQHTTHTAHSPQTTDHRPQPTAHTYTFYFLFVSTFYFLFFLFFFQNQLPPGATESQEDQCAANAISHLTWRLHFHHREAVWNHLLVSHLSGSLLRKKVRVRVTMSCVHHN